MKLKTLSLTLISCAALFAADVDINLTLSGRKGIIYSPSDFVPGDFATGNLTVTNSMKFGPLVRDDMTWTSRDLLLHLHREQLLTTNWVTVETINITQTNGLDCTYNRLIQVGKVVTNEVVSIDFEGQKKELTFFLGESSYKEQQTITNKEAIVGAGLTGKLPPGSINWGVSYPVIK